MDIEDALRLRLIEDQAAAAIVAPYENTKAVFWGLRPQCSPLPAIVLSWVPSAMAEHMKGLQSLQFWRLQVDTYADSVIDAQQLRDACVRALQPRYRGHGYYFRPAGIYGPRDLPEKTSTGTIYRTSTDMIVRFSPA